MRRFVPALYFCFVLVSGLLVQAQTLTTLASFDGSNGYSPSGPLIQADDGNLYGVSAQGGVQNGGVLFQATTPGTLTVGPAFNIYTLGISPAGRLLKKTPSGGLSMALRGVRTPGSRMFSSPTSRDFTDGSDPAPGAIWKQG